MSDHSPNYDQPIDTSKEEEQRDYKRFEENPKVQSATKRELFLLMQQGRWDLIAEFKYRRPQLRKFVEELEIAWFDDHEARMAEWK